MLALLIIDMVVCPVIWASSGQITGPDHSSFAIAVLVLFTPFADDVLDLAIGPVIWSVYLGNWANHCPYHL